jgi:hypothetical protein
MKDTSFCAKFSLIFRITWLLVKSSEGAFNMKEVEEESSEESKIEIEDIKIRERGKRDIEKVLENEESERNMQV